MFLGNLKWHTKLRTKKIKKYSHVGGRLCLTVAITKIEADVLGGVSTKGNSEPRLISASGYSIARLFKKINPTDKHFLKYVPDGFLSFTQKEGKRAALEEDAK